MKRERAYAVLTTAAAVSIVNAFRPFRRPAAAAVGAFFAGWPTAELPLHVLGAQAVGTAIAARSGAIRGRAGVAGLALTAASWAGLLALHLRARETPRLLEGALETALGSDYRTRVVHPRASEVAIDQAKLPGALRVSLIRGRYAEAADIAYGPHGKLNQLDIWRRADLAAGAGAPVLIQLPGGAWTVGNKEGQAYPLMATMVELGWGCVPISYRLAPTSPWPAHIIDVKRAIAWVKEHIEEYGGDPDFVAITGGSAGGHLSSLAALTWDDPAYQPGFEAADTSVQAAVPLYGVYDWTKNETKQGRVQLLLLERLVMKARWNDSDAPFIAASPVRRVRRDAPPFFVIAAANDTLVPPDQPRSFVAALRGSSDERVAAATLPDAQHAFDIFASPRTVATVKAIADFLGVIYGVYRARVTAG